MGRRSVAPAFRHSHRPPATGVRVPPFPEPAAARCATGPQRDSTTPTRPPQLTGRPFPARTPSSSLPHPTHRLTESLHVRTHLRSQYILVMHNNVVREPIAVNRGICRESF